MPGWISCGGGRGRGVLPLHHLPQTSQEGPAPSFCAHPRRRRDPGSPYLLRLGTSPRAESLLEAAAETLPLVLRSCLPAFPPSRCPVRFIAPGSVHASSAPLARLPRAACAPSSPAREALPGTCTPTPSPTPCKDIHTHTAPRISAALSRPTQIQLEQRFSEDKYTRIPFLTQSFFGLFCRGSF